MNIGRYLIAILATSIIALVFTALGNIVINEIDLAPSENLLPVWVELCNAGDGPVEIGGWYVQVVNPPWRGDLIAPQGTVMQANEYYVLYGDSRWVHDSGGVAILRNAAGIEVDRSPLFQDNRTDDFSWSRFPDGKDTGRKSDWAYIRASRGYINSLF
jgi:hypothetical protein